MSLDIRNSYNCPLLPVQNSGNDRGFDPGFDGHLWNVGCAVRSESVKSPCCSQWFLEWMVLGYNSQRPPVKCGGGLWINAIRVDSRYPQTSNIPI